MATWFTYRSARAYGRMLRTWGGVTVSPTYLRDAFFEVDVNNPAPTIDSITPNFGGSTLETTVTINGSNFGATQGNGYVFCKHTRAARYTSWSDTQIVCDLGMHPSFDGLSDLTVTRDSGQSGTLSNAFDAKPTPYISIMPVTVSIYGGTKIKLRGWNFLSTQGTGTVTVDGIAVEEILSWSDGAIDAITPGHVTLGTVNVVVTNSLGYSGTLQITTSNAASYITRYYVYPNATGSGTGLYPEDAFTDIVTALQTVDVTYRSQTIYAKGTQNMGAGVRITEEILAYFGRYLRIIGCNDNWEVDDIATFTINFNHNYVNSITYCWQTATSARWYLRNLTITNSGTNTLGISLGYGSTRSHNILINVNAPTLLYNQTGYAQIFLKCDFLNYSAADGFIAFSRIRGYLSAYTQPVAYACITKQLNGWVSINCIADRSATYGCNGGGQLYGCRATNNSTWGKVSNATSLVNFIVGSFFLNNTSGAIQAPAAGVYEKQISVETTGVEGYNDDANGNYNLTTTATNRNVPINIGCFNRDNINKSYISAGLNPSLKAQLNQKSYMTKHVGIWSPRG